jgi:hypothetical protein
MAVAKTLAYCDTATFTAVKGFIVLAPGVSTCHTFTYLCHPLSG